MAITDDDATAEEEASEIVRLDAETQESETDILATYAQLGSCLVPVVMAHLAVIGVFLLAVTGFRFSLPRHSDVFLAWIGISGALFGMGWIMWRRGIMPVGGERWLRGKGVRPAVAILILGSAGWFFAPSALSDTWALLRGWASRW